MRCTCFFLKRLIGIKFWLGICSPHWHYLRLCRKRKLVTLLKCPQNGMARNIKFMFKQNTFYGADFIIISFYIKYWISIPLYFESKISNNFLIRNRGFPEILIFILLSLFEIKKRIYLNFFILHLFKFENGKLVVADRSRDLT